MSMNVQVTRVKMADNAKTGSTSSHVLARLDTSVIHVPVSDHAVHHLMTCQSAKWNKFYLRLCVVILFFVIGACVMWFFSKALPISLCLLKMSMNVKVTHVKMADNAKTGSTSSHVLARLDTSVILVPVRSYPVHHLMAWQSARWTILNNFMINAQYSRLFCNCHMVLISGYHTQVKFIHTRVVRKVRGHCQ